MRLLPSFNQDASLPLLLLLLPPPPRHGATARHLPRRPCQPSNSKTPRLSQLSPPRPAARPPPPRPASCIYFVRPRCDALPGCPFAGPLRFRHRLAPGRAKVRAAPVWQRQWQRPRAHLWWLPPLHVSVPSVGRADRPAFLSSPSSSPNYAAVQSAVPPISDPVRCVATVQLLYQRSCCGLCINLSLLLRNK